MALVTEDGWRTFWLSSAALPAVSAGDANTDANGRAD